MKEKVIAYRSVSVDKTYHNWFRCIALLALVICLEAMFVLLVSAYLYTNNSHRRESRHRATGGSDSKSPEDFLQEIKLKCLSKSNSTKIFPDSSNPASRTCACIPQNFSGWRPIMETDEHPEIGELEIKHKELFPGGAWYPQNCTARHQVAIIIPFRDRESHLRALLHVLHPILQKQNLHYRIFVIEQAAPVVFNKAAMMNIGFKEAKRLDCYDCFIFHDVDMLPEDDRNMYICDDNPRHLGSYVDKFKYKVPYPELFGGATAFTGDQFQKANGYSNGFYGWGGEDDDMYNRVVAAGMNVVRPPQSVARYHMIKHQQDHGNPPNRHSYIAWKVRPEIYKVDGLNSLRYKLLMYEFRPLYTWIYAEIPDFNRVPAPSWKAQSKANSFYQRTLIILLPLYSTCWMVLSPVNF